MKTEQIRQIACLPERKPSTAWSRVGMAVLQVIGGAIIAAGAIAQVLHTCPATVSGGSGQPGLMPASLGS
jgi:hypothetical protein